ncbi:MAG: hypothetical protein JXR51_02175 [Bacteroidales bacterium]|nr:hypothetical protein [Bacteroidales bacterium]MBN2755954.1 hypothetical protein [Bacteroidales bacterium]
MKKLLLSLAFAGMFVFVACTPSVDEQAEQAKLDSLRQDSIMQVQVDSLAAIEKAKTDSINAAADQLKADSIAVEEAKAVKK